MAVSVSLNTPLADQLSNVVQPKLVEVGWSTGGLDDSALAEYIILMLVNGKTQEQIAAELSTDLLNLGPDDTGAIDFSRWLFEQVEVIGAQLSGGSASQSAPPNLQIQTQAIPSFSGQDTTLLRRERKQSGSGSSPDADMAEAMDGVQDGVIPTGPKSMRSGGRNSNKRLIGQLSKAMDRSTDAVLHRVRPQQGTERINMHNRPPPKGPRNDQSRGPRMPLNGRPIVPSLGGMPNGGPAGALVNMSPQQQMQLFAMYEQQARMMSEILSPQQQQMFMPGVAQPAMNPTFGNRAPPPIQQPGRSLFDRVEGKPQPPRQNGHINKRPQQNGGSKYIHGQQDTEMLNSDLSSSMEVESSQPSPADLSPDTTCKFNLTCTKKDCPYAHQSPAAPPGTTIDVNDHCPFGAACRNRKCVARHPSPSQKISHQAEQDCKFFPNCTNTSCPFKHPMMPMCRNGADCTRPNCKFTHVQTKCRFNPCLNSTCPYKHEEGQKRGAFDDKVWVAEGSQEREHVSERKFVDDEAVGEELIVPGNQGLGSQSSSLGAELVT